MKSRSTANGPPLNTVEIGSPRWSRSALQLAGTAADRLLVLQDVIVASVTKVSRLRPYSSLVLLKKLSPWVLPSESANVTLLYQDQLLRNRRLTCSCNPWYSRYPSSKLARIRSPSSRLPPGD